MRASINPMPTIMRIPQSFGLRRLNFARKANAVKRISGKNAREISKGVRTYLRIINDGKISEEEVTGRPV